MNVGQLSNEEYLKDHLPWLIDSPLFMKEAIILQRNSDWPLNAHIMSDRVINSPLIKMRVITEESVPK